MPSGRLSKNIDVKYSSIFHEKTNFYILTLELKAETVTKVKCSFLTTRWKCDIIRLIYCNALLCREDTPPGISNKNCTGFLAPLAEGQRAIVMAW